MSFAQSVLIELTMLYLHTTSTIFHRYKSNWPRPPALWLSFLWFSFDSSEAKRVSEEKMAELLVQMSSYFFLKFSLVQVELLNWWFESIAAPSFCPHVQYCPTCSSKLLFNLQSGTAELVSWWWIHHADNVPSIWLDIAVLWPLKDAKTWGEAGEDGKECAAT